MNLSGKKITRATVKKVIKDNLDAGKLFIQCYQRFSGMTDMCENVENNGFEIALKSERHMENTLGIQGAWFVGSGGDYFTYEVRDGFHIIGVSNCCGSFEIAVKG